MKKILALIVNTALISLASASFFAGATLAAAPSSSEKSAVFITPSLGYGKLEYTAPAKPAKLESNISMLNLDIEVISGMAYHQINLGRSFSDSSDLDTGAAKKAKADVDLAKAGYRVGLMNLSTFTGDFSIWTGLGWEAMKASLDDPDEPIRTDFIYAPFGLELAFHHAGNSYWILGAEYRLALKNWQRFDGGISGHPQQDDITAYAVWLGMDYITSNKRALTARLSLDKWKVAENTLEETLEAKMNLLNFSLGVRF